MKCIIFPTIKYHTQPRTPYGKVTKHKNTSHIREPRGQPFPSRWSEGCKERQDSLAKTNKKHKDPQKKRRLGTVSKEVQEGFNIMVPTSPLILMWIQTHRCLVCMKYPQLIDAPSHSTYKSGCKKEIKQRYGPNSTYNWILEQKKSNS